MEQDRLQYLLAKLEGRATTDAELDELAALVRDDDAEVWLPLAEAAWMEDRQRFEDNYDDGKWMGIAARIVTADKMRAKPVNYAYRWAAAAVILILLMSGGYLLWRPSPQSNPAVVRTNDIAAGSNKAILTLADGSKVTLDSTGNQVIQQDAASIQQQGGVLAYHVTGAAATLSYNTLTTPRGGQYQLVLPDGSKVWLNAASSIRFPVAFQGASRMVELTGEAYFEVKPSARQGFSVKLNRSIVEVLGTSFNINSYADEAAIKTTLLEGSVRVRSRLDTRVLRPGQQANAAKDGSLEVAENVNTEEVMAWKNGLFLFNRVGLQEVMRQLARWYDVDIVYEGNVSEQKFFGEIQRELSLTEVLSVLEKSGVHFRLEEKKIIVSAKH